jgi:ferredoxin-NADP reductase
MPGTDPASERKLPWRVAEVKEIIEETPRVRTLKLDVPGWPGHRPGQHVDVRLTGEDGFSAQRSYSIASAPEASKLSLSIERIEEGEVSPYLASEVLPGDRFELRGPIGGYFVWTVASGGPLFLVAGGSGIAPLMAMLRHRAALESKIPTVLLYSVRRFEEIIYREELDRLAAKGDGLKIFYTLTRKQPPGWSGGKKRIDREVLAQFGFPPAEKPRIFICGPTSLVETAARTLAGIGHERSLIKTERFGPTGA